MQIANLGATIEMKYAKDEFVIDASYEQRIVADLRGEILLSKGDKQGARAAWEAGVKSDASPALSEMMRMKMNNLSI